MKFNPHWEYVSDQVMGGVSRGRVTCLEEEDGPVYRLTGSVSLDNNGGFVQMAFDLSEKGQTVDVSAWSGLEMEVCGNCEVYDLRLRTAQLARPWQSFRTSFVAAREWQIQRFRFDEFEPHRTDAKFDVTSLRRVGVLAIGRVFQADVSVRSVGFYQ